jgi:hypothetical protein
MKVHAVAPSKGKGTPTLSDLRERHPTVDLRVLKLVTQTYAGG